MRARPRLAITLGDPRGIGPEVVAAAIADSRVRRAAEVVLVGPSGTEVAVDEPVGVWQREGSEAADIAGGLAGRAIERAVALAQAGVVQGIVTGPIDKRALFEGGFDYAGHTEMLAALTRSHVAMMLASDRLRVVLVTTHLPLRDVPRKLTASGIVQCARITEQGLRDWYGIAEPRIALCALNPHAGDGGRFGDEDRILLAPAAKAAGIAGPYSADTVFVRAIRGEFDAVLAPYHDVGMTAIKVASFGTAVNVTLGLPFPRTSPDHGTAFDIAGRGIADPSSFISRDSRVRANRRPGRPPSRASGCRMSARLSSRSSLLCLVVVAAGCSASIRRPPPVATARVTTASGATKDTSVRQLDVPVSADSEAVAALVRQGMRHSRVGAGFGISVGCDRPTPDRVGGSHARYEMDSREIQGIQSRQRVDGVVALWTRVGAGADHAHAVGAAHSTTDRRVMGLGPRDEGPGDRRCDLHERADDGRVRRRILLAPYAASGSSPDRPRPYGTAMVRR